MPCMAELPYMLCQQPIIPVMCNKNEGAYFWSSDQIVISDSLSNGIVRNISLYHSGIRRMTSRLISTTENVRPSYSVRLVK